MGVDDDEERAGETPDAAGVPARHVHSAWRSWLSALASDSEAAMAAALAYESLPPEARDAWLDALEADGPTIDVPTVALYAPLLAVEYSEARRARIEGKISSPAASRQGGGGRVEARALRGVAVDGTHVCVIAAPLYLDFVQVVVCRYTPGGGVLTVRHDPLRHAAELTLFQERTGTSLAPEVEGASVEPTPLRLVIEELAHAILADRREHRETPAALASVAHLFGPHLDDTDDADEDDPRDAPP
jgi:hypothetical protein